MVQPARALAAMLFVLAILASACSEPQVNSRAEQPANGAYPLTLTDDEGSETTLEAAPERVVTFAPSHTEIVFALGLGDRLVGVAGSFDDYPAEAQEVEQVAGRTGVEPNIEKVVSLEPDVVLTAFIGGEWKERLRELDIPVFTTLAASLEDTLDDIRTIGTLLGEEDAAGDLVADMRSDVEDVTEDVAGAAPVSCFLDLSDLFTVGPGSLEYDLLQKAGCDPITATADDPYPQWSLEQLVKDDPDVYLVAEGVSVEEVSQQPGIRELTAVQQGRIRQVNADLISRPGPRVVQGLQEVSSALQGRAAA